MKVVPIMQLNITSVTDATPVSIVEFTCPYGAGRGRWATGVPKLGQEYDVELDFNDPLRIGVNVEVTDNEIPSIRNSDHQITIVAKVEDLFDDHTGSLRLGESLILVEFEGVLPVVETWVEIRLPEIELFDTGI